MAEKLTRESVVDLPLGSVCATGSTVFIRLDRPENPMYCWASPGGWWSGHQLDAYIGDDLQVLRRGLR